MGITYPCKPAPKRRATTPNEVVALLYALTQAADDQGLTLSRWRTNRSNGRPLRITYALHPGPRPRTSAQLPPTTPTVILTHPEGRTRRCQAFRLLSALLP